MRNAQKVPLKILFGKTWVICINPNKNKENKTVTPSFTTQKKVTLTSSTFSGFIEDSLQIIATRNLSLQQLMLGKEEAHLD